MNVVMEPIRGPLQVAIARVANLPRPVSASGIVKYGDSAYDDYSDSAYTDSPYGDYSDYDDAPDP